MWRSQTLELSTRHRVIAPDLPGAGQSEPVSPNASPMDRMGDSVAVLLETLRITRAVVGGCSMGGYVALALARRYPKMVRGLILTNTRAAADTDAARQNRERMAQSLMQRGMVELEENLFPKLLGPNASEALKSEVLGMIRAGSPVGSAAASRGMAARLDSLAWLARCPCPVLVIHSAQDAIISREEAEAMSRAAPSATFVELENAGHLSPLEQPEAWNAAVRTWLEKLPR
jgi:pimeloyl-ACP methyl ester carboxylesterase